jgi:DNA polymerase I-like protein with 3'-5' exonuclease and polymerase domains
LDNNKMQINFNNITVEFRPWNIGQGRVFQKGFAFDSETKLIDKKRPWLTPAYVIGAAYDGNSGVFLTRENVESFFQIHAGLPVYMHNANFDLRVLALVFESLDIYELVDRDLIWDTQLLYRLFQLATEGHTANGRDQKSSLDHCAQELLNWELPKDLEDLEGDQVRLSYGKFLGEPPQKIPAVYLEYLAKDVIATYSVFHHLSREIDRVLSRSEGVRGYVSPEWLESQRKQWGALTHHIQLKASVVLNEISASGICIDSKRVELLTSQLEQKREELGSRLRQQGLLPEGEGSQKALQAIMRRLEREHRELRFPRTPSGMYATNRESLEELHGVGFVDDYLEYKAVKNLLSTFLSKLEMGRVHPSFGILQRTGRTSSFGELNAQNLPRKDGIRDCFIPSKGYIFINADYQTVEMATLAQSIIRQFGLPSKMADAINAGLDLHELVAKEVAGQIGKEYQPADRQKAKPINFGKPGGMGNEGLRRYARSGYGVELTEGDVSALTKTWFQLFPEMETYLEGDSNLGLQIAKLFNLTPYTHSKHTGSNLFSRQCRRECELHSPSAILGWMFRKTLLSGNPETERGEAYSQADIEFFWSQPLEKKELFSKKERALLEARRPSKELIKEIVRLADQAPCFTATGRLRNKAGFCARCNTLFQGLASDGAKLAMWKLWRAGYRIVNFIHDEFLIEVPEDSNLKEHAGRIEKLMIQGMRLVVPDVAIRVEYSASDRWSKSAKKKVDRQGRLLVYSDRDDATLPALAPGNALSSIINATPSQADAI